MQNRDVHNHQWSLVSLFVTLAFRSATLAQVPAFNPATIAGTVTNPALNEVSGLAASRLNPGVLWAHNDSGDTPTLYALSTNGALLASYTLTGTSAYDWEDLAIGSGPVDGLPYLYVADIGDNQAVRSEIRVIQAPEPAIGDGPPPIITNLSGAVTYTFAYPDGARDAEALLIDPETGDWYIVTKQILFARAYRAAWPPSPTGTNTLEFVTNLVSSVVTAGEVSPSGRQILLRSYFTVEYYSRTLSQSLGEALSSTLTQVPSTNEPQGEAIAWAADESGYFTLSENINQPLHWFGGSDTDLDGLVDPIEIALTTNLELPDSDGDGQRDGDEVVAGVDPTDVHSFFALDSVTRSGGSLAIQWFARTNRIYDIQWQTNALWESYEIFATNIVVASDQSITTNIPATAPVSAVRLRVRAVGP